MFLLLLYACVDCNTYHSQQDLTKKLEKTVNTLVEESTQAGAMNDLQTVS